MGMDLHGTDLDILHICGICVAWPLVGLLRVGAGPVSYSFTDFWVSLKHGEVLSITATLYTMLYTRAEERSGW